MPTETSCAASQQTCFLTQLQAAAVLTAIHLKNGIKLQGLITAFDEHVIILRHGAISQVVFKHAISTVSLQAETGMRRL